MVASAAGAGASKHNTAAAAAAAAQQRTDNTLLRSWDCCGSSEATDTTPPPNRTTGGGTAATAVSTAAVTAARDRITTEPLRAAAAERNKRQRRRWCNKLGIQLLLEELDGSFKRKEVNPTQQTAVAGNEWSLCNYSDEVLVACELRSIIPDIQIQSLPFLGCQIAEAMDSLWDLHQGINVLAVLIPH
jgi:hypothetical protein